MEGDRRRSERMLTTGRGKCERGASGGAGHSRKDVVEIEFSDGSVERFFHVFQEWGIATTSDELPGAMQSLRDDDAAAGAKRARHVEKSPVRDAPRVRCLAPRGQALHIAWASDSEHRTALGAQGAKGCAALTPRAKLAAQGAPQRRVPVLLCSVRRSLTIARLKRRWTISDLCSNARVSKHDALAFELGTRFPTAAALCRLEHALRVQLTPSLSCGRPAHQIDGATGFASSFQGTAPRVLA